MSSQSTLFSIADTNMIESTGATDERTVALETVGSNSTNTLASTAVSDSANVDGNAIRDMWLETCRKLVDSGRDVAVHLASQTPPKVPAVTQAIKNVLEKNGIRATVLCHMVDCADAAGNSQPINGKQCQDAAAARSRQLAEACAEAAGGTVLYRKEENDHIKKPYMDGLMIVLESCMMLEQGHIVDRCWGRIEYEGKLINADFGEPSPPEEVFAKFGLVAYAREQFDTKYDECLESEEGLRNALNMAAEDMINPPAGGVTLGMLMQWLIERKSNQKETIDHKDWQSHTRHGKTRQELIEDQICGLMTG